MVSDTWRGSDTGPICGEARCPGLRPAGPGRSLRGTLAGLGAHQRLRFRCDSSDSPHSSRWVVTFHVCPGQAGRVPCLDLMPDPRRLPSYSETCWAGRGVPCDAGYRGEPCEEARLWHRPFQQASRTAAACGESSLAGETAELGTGTGTGRARLEVAGKGVGGWGTSNQGEAACALRVHVGETVPFLVHVSLTPAAWDPGGPRQVCVAGEATASCHGSHGR